MFALSLFCNQEYCHSSKVNCALARSTTHRGGYRGGAWGAGAPPPWSWTKKSPADI